MSSSSFCKVVASNRLKFPIVKFQLDNSDLISLRDRGILICLKSSQIKTYALDLTHFINRESCEINIQKIIPVIRGLADVADKLPDKILSLSFFNLYDAVELLGVEKYRDRDFVIQTLRRFKELFAKHFYSYCKVMNKPCTLVFRSLRKGGFPRNQLYNGRGLGKPTIHINMQERTYYIHENLYKDLLAYGFSDKQIKEVIGVQVDANGKAIPTFLIRRHLRIPNITKELERELEDTATLNLLDSSKTTKGEISHE